MTNFWGVRSGVSVMCLLCVCIGLLSLLDMKPSEYWKHFSPTFRWKHQHQDSEKINYLANNIWTFLFSLGTEEMNDNNEWRNICLWKYFWEIRKEEWVVGILCVLLCVFVLSKFNRKNPNFSRCFLHWKSVHRVGGWCWWCDQIPVSRHQSVAKLYPACASLVEMKRKMSLC